MSEKEEEPIFTNADLSRMIIELQSRVKTLQEAMNLMLDELKELAKD